MAATVGTCDNCGSDEESCNPVHRVYLVPDQVTVAETERWCVSCRSQYPHQEAHIAR